MVASQAESPSAALHRLVARACIGLALSLLLVGPLLALSTAEAEELDLAPYRGKIVLVDFWASWCTPCRQSFPWLNALQQRYADHGLVILAVNVDPDRTQAERFLRDTPAQFQILYDPRGRLAKKYELMGMPSSFVFGPDGALLNTHIGFKNGERGDRESEIVRLLQEHVRAEP